MGGEKVREVATGGWKGWWRRWWGGGVRKVGRWQQGELEWGAVKVVRNDLRMADVEVVEVEGDRKRGGEVKMSAACRGRIWRLWWGSGMRGWARWGGKKSGTET